MLAQRAVADSPRWTRAVEDQSAPIPKEVTSELGGSIIEMCSPGTRARLDALGVGWVRKLRAIKGRPVCPPVNRGKMRVEEKEQVRS